jgi:hypothetical protein
MHLDRVLVDLHLVVVEFDDVLGRIVGLQKTSRRILKRGHAS